jgi:hypothetical protein
MHHPNRPSSARLGTSLLIVVATLVGLLAIVAPASVTSAAGAVSQLGDQPRPEAGDELRRRCIELVDAGFESANQIVADDPNVTSVGDIMRFQSEWVVRFGSTQQHHLCDVLPIYFPGVELGAAGELREHALEANPHWVVQGLVSARSTDWHDGKRWADGPDSEVYPNEPGWPVTYSAGCSADASTLQAQSGETPTCDEFPNATMASGGDQQVYGHRHQPAIAHIQQVDDNNERRRWRDFLEACDVPEAATNASLEDIPGHDLVLVVPIARLGRSSVTDRCGDRNFICDLGDCSKPPAPACLTFGNGILPKLVDLPPGITLEVAPDRLGNSPFNRVRVEASVSDSYGVGWNNPILNTNPDEHVTIEVSWLIGKGGELEAPKRFGNIGLSTSVEGTRGRTMTASVTLPKDAYEAVSENRPASPSPEGPRLPAERCFPTLFAPSRWPVGTMYRLSSGLTGAIAGEAGLAHLRLGLGLSRTRSIDFMMVKADEDTVRFFAGPSDAMAQHLSLRAGWTAYVSSGRVRDWSQQRLVGRFLDLHVRDRVIAPYEQDRIWKRLLDSDPSTPFLDVEDRGRIVLTHTSASESLGLQYGDVFSGLREEAEGNSRVLEVFHQDGKRGEEWYEFERFTVNEQGALGYLFQYSSLDECSLNSLIQFEPEPGLTHAYRDAFEPSAPDPEPSDPFAITVRMPEAGLSQIKQLSDPSADFVVHDMVVSRNTVGELYGALVDGNYPFDSLVTHLQASQFLREQAGQAPLDLTQVKVSYGDVDHLGHCAGLPRPPAPSAGCDLLRNGGFEEGRDAWTNWEPDYPSIIDDADVGTSAARIVALQSPIRQDVHHLDGGRKYRLRLRYRNSTETGNEGVATPRVDFFAADGKYLGRAGIEPAYNRVYRYTDLSVILTAPAETVRARVSLANGAYRAGQFPTGWTDYDQVRFEKLVETPTECVPRALPSTHHLTPGNLSERWPDLEPGDVVHLDPGRYTGGDITLSAAGTAEEPVKILKTPGSSGDVVFDGQGRHNHLFNITGSHIEFGGSAIGDGWRPDLRLENYTYAGLRMRKEANNIHIHHVHFRETGSFGVRFNGQNVLFEYNRIEDPDADALQVETGGGVDVRNWTIRYNYGSNRLSDDGPWAFNAANHADFVQIQRGPASDVTVHGNLLVGYTNALLVGDSWGSATTVEVTDNFIVFEANGISTQSRGNLDGTYLISHNHLVMYQVDGVDGGGRSAILLNDTDGSGQATIACNVFYGAKNDINTNIDGTIDVRPEGNLATGRTTSMSEVEPTVVDLGYGMEGARDLSGIHTLNSVQADTSCSKPQGAPFSSVGEHLGYARSGGSARGRSGPGTGESPPTGGGGGAPNPGGTPGGSESTTSTFVPIDDAFVKVGTANGDDGGRLRIRESDSSTYETFLKFDVQGIQGPVSDAVLRLAIPDGDGGSNDGGSLFLLDPSSNGWAEHEIDGINRPTETGALLARAGDARNNSVVEFPLGTAIDSDGTYTLVLRSGSTWSGYYHSKDQPDPDLAPQLIISHHGSASGGAGGRPGGSVPEAGPVSYVAADDATIKVGTTNGYDDELRVRTADSSTYHGYLKFEVDDLAGQVTEATITLTVEAESSDGGTLYRAAHDGWSETTIDGTNAPGDNGIPIRSLGDITGRRQVVIDVTDQIDGNGTYSFVLRSDSSWTGRYVAKETNIAEAPVLTVKTS